MKRILICVECMDYSYLAEAKPKNIMSYAPHAAVSFGVGSRAAVAALLGGMLPICEDPHCYHHQLVKRWANPFFLTEATQNGKVFLLCPNGWVVELIQPWIDQEQKELNLKWMGKHAELPASQMVDYLLEKERGLKSYFAYLHFFETHPPFYSPKGHDRKEALLYLDNQIGRILDLEAEIVIVSDHNVPPGISAATSTPIPNTMKSFIASKPEFYGLTC